MRAQRIASRLMVELCGAKLVPGTIDVAAEAAGARGSLLRGERVEGLLGHGDRRRPTRPHTWSGSASASRPTARTCAVDRAPRPPLRRDPRGRPDRGGRPRPRPRRAPALDAAGRRRPGRGPEPRTAAAPPRRGRDARPRLRRDRRLELHRPRRGGAAADPRGRSAGRGHRRLQPALRGPVGDAHDPDRRRCSTARERTSPAAPIASRCSSRAGSTCRGGGAGRRASGRRASRATGPRRSRSRTGSAAWPSGRSCRRPGAARGERPTSSRSRACSRRSPARLGAELAFEPASRAVPAPGPGRGGRRRRRGRRLDRRGPPARLPAPGTSSAAAAFEVDLAALVGAAGAGEEIYEDVTSFPAVYQDLAVVVPADVAGRAGARGRARRRRRAAALGRGLRPLSKASSSARGARAWRCGSSSGPPTGPSPTRRSPSVREAIEAELAEIGGSLRE